MERDGGGGDGGIHPAVGMEWCLLGLQLFFVGGHRYSDGERIGGMLGRMREAEEWLAGTLNNLFYDRKDHGLLLGCLCLCHKVSVRNSVHMFQGLDWFMCNYTF